MDDGYVCDHAWVVERSVRTDVEQDQQGRRVARFISKYWRCRTCGAHDVTVQREEVGGISYEGYER